MLEDFSPLQWAVERVPLNSWVPSLVNKLPRFVGISNNQKSLLSFLDVWIPRFLPNRLTSEEARHQGPRIVRESSFEPNRDGLGDMVFQGKAVHILVEAHYRRCSNRPKSSQKGFGTLVHYSTTCRATGYASNNSSAS